MAAIDPVHSSSSPILESNLTNPSCTSIASVGSWKKRILENTVDPYNGDNPKFKRANVSADRDFPKGCGRFAVIINETQCLDNVGVDTAEILAIGAECVASLQSETLEATIKIDVQSELHGLPENADGNEGMGLSRSVVRSEFVGVSKSSDCSEPMEISKSSDMPDSIEVSNGSDQSEMVLTIRKSEQTDVVKSLKVSYQHEQSAEEVVGKKNVHRRRVSAVRDFPYGIGRSSPRLAKEEILKSAASARNGNHYGGKFLGEKKLEKQAGVAIKTHKLEKIESEHKRKESGKVVKAVEIEEVKSKIKTSMCIVPVEAGGRSADIDEPQVMDDLDIFSNKVIVQALMAKPYCPWRQGLILKIKPTNFLRKEVNSIGKTVKQKENSLAKKKRSLTTGEASSKLKNIMVFKGEEEDLPHEGTNLLLMLEGKKENLPNGDVVTTLAPNSQEVSLTLNHSHGKDKSDETVTRNKVRETLRLFQVIFRKLLQEEETKQKEKIKRIDIAVYNLLKEKNKWVNTGKPILGVVPGVEIGDEFHYRVELIIIGLHRQIQCGIDFVKQGKKILATSIVASDGADDMDSSDLLIYSGEGGSRAQGDKQPVDQKLERGNLALKNSLDSKTPVRVIRGFKEFKNGTQDTRAKSISTLTYDGLYLVEKYWREKGPYGFTVFKFQLRRMAGQPELAWKVAKQVKKSKKSAPREGLCMDDISQGEEKMPICAVNTIDNDRPPPFKYITKMIYPDWYEPSSPRGCDCTNGCSDSQNCACAVKNGGEIPFNHNGAIVWAKPLVYECGPTCKCPPTCPNRVSQHGIKLQVEIFKTESRGWGVRSLTSIPSGSFICEYTGELLRDTEADKRTGNDEYLFDIGHNYNDHSLWDGLSTLIPDLQLSVASDVVENMGFTIDALEYGSVGRFINHSCSPNLYAQNVLYDHGDKRMPHIMLFAAENIPPLQELTYHYNYNVDQVKDSNGNVKKKTCYCGSHECTGRLY